MTDTLNVRLGSINMVTIDELADTYELTRSDVVRTILGAVSYNKIVRSLVEDRLQIVCESR